MPAAPRRQGCNQSQIARLHGRHRSTACREPLRNGTRADGPIRQYLPKGVSIVGPTQHQSNAIARKLNTRPRKWPGFRTPLECFDES